MAGFIAIKHKTVISKRVKAVNKSYTFNRISDIKQQNETKRTKLKIKVENKCNES